MMVELGDVETTVALLALANLNQNSLAWTQFTVDS